MRRSRVIPQARNRRWLGAALVAAVWLVGSTSSAGVMAYITNADSDTVSVIDTATAGLVATIPVGAVPVGVAVDRTGSRVYVTNLGSHTVSVIDATTNLVSAVIPVGTLPNGVAVDPSGTRVYVANQGDDSISIIDTASDQVIDTVFVECSLTVGVAVLPDGRRVYASCAGDPDAVVVLDAATHAVESMIALPEGSNPKGVSTSADGTRVYVALAAGGQVAVIDTAIDGLVATIPVGPAPQMAAVHPAGDRIYVTSFGAGTLSVIDTAAFETLEVLDAGRPLGVDVTPDGSKVFVADAGSTSTRVFVVDAATNTVAGTVTVGSRPHAFGKFIRAGGASLEVEIDIRPGDDRNNVNPRSNGMLPVAVLGSAGVNVADLDLTSLRFGPWEAEPATDLSHPDVLAEALVDVNLDGFTDLLLQFRVAETGLRCGDEEATLLGSGTSGASFQASDALTTVGCRGGGSPGAGRGHQDRGQRPGRGRGRSL